MIYLVTLGFVLVKSGKSFPVQEFLCAEVYSFLPDHFKVHAVGLVVESLGFERGVFVGI